ncbi:hypothetical protein [Rhodovulum sp. PH10]|uniref:hypothetical protein n=1 Tax=Rhodovulum sp. PH10 TaxID=1187851 RepID=UPI0002EF4A5C|nr:hypothetical protein [Rhodovulum sp. PH10]
MMFPLPIPPGRGTAPARRAGALAAAVLALGVLASPAARAQQPPATDELPALRTNQAQLDELSRPTVLDTKDPMAVFAFVFARLPERVKVYPTENYYYFTFVHAGIPYNGNIRLDASDRDRGKVHFAYSEDLVEWRDETDVIHELLGEAQDVQVEKVEPLLYRITYQGKSVLFALNDLSKVKPPKDALAPDETFVGPICDESGIRFFLVFDNKLKQFLYILDETERVPEQFEPRKSGRVEIGKRTGFAFYRDDKLPRKILVGVYFGNSRVNNYFDGPFDQMPDNFIQGDSFRDMLLQVDPSLKGTIDRFGGWPDGSQRFMIAPYYYYQDIEELAAFDACATDKRVSPEKYYACFVADEDSQAEFKLVPRAVKELAAAKNRKKK